MLARMRGRGAMSHGDRGSQHAGAGPAAWAAAHDAGPSVGRTGGCHGERLPGASTTRHGATELMGSCHDRLRPHEPIGDRVPADVMEGFFERFERALARDPEAMQAA